MGRSNDEISFHFHFDRILIDEFRSFHLHLHVAEGDRGIGSPAGVDPAESIESHRRYTDADLTICTPQQYGATDVKVDSGGVGHICAVVRAVRSGVEAEEVRACVMSYQCPDLGDLPDAPDPSTTVEGIHIERPPHPYEDCNFFFVEECGNLIPGAAHNIDGTAQNCLAVWARFYGQTQWEAAMTGFSGHTAYQVSCASIGSCGSFTPLAARAPRSLADQLLPQQYRLWLDSHADLEALRGSSLDGAREELNRLARSGPIVLSRDRTRGTDAIPQWTRRCPRDGTWNLRIAQTPKGPAAVVTCIAAGSYKLPSDAAWKSRAWYPLAANRMTPIRPATLIASGLTCMVEPA